MEGILSRNVLENYNKLTKQLERLLLLMRIIKEIFGTILITQVCGFALGLSAAAVCTSSAEDWRRYRKGKDTYISHRM